MSLATRPLARARADEPRTPRPGAPTLATAAAFVLILVALAAMHGFFWGESQPMVQTILDSGAIKCLHDQGLGALTAHCNAVGQPIGLTFVTGMPETMVGWLLSWIPGVDAWAAHQILNVGLDAIALAAGYFLLRRWAVVRWIALLAAAIYLVSPSLIGVNGFQYTFTGYEFLPLYVLLFLTALDRFDTGRARAGLVYVVGVTLLMVFTDGYSYATALLLTGVVMIAWLVRSTRASRRIKAIAVGGFGAANVFALAAYSAYVNVPAEPHYPLGRFRLLSLDLVTLFTPQERLIWPSHVGFHPARLKLWGDGSNFLFNYMGFLMLGLVAWLLIARRMRRQPAAQRAELIPLLVAGAIALFLSFGPALKINSHVDTTAPVLNLPLSKATVGLPTSVLYAHFPPFTAMRAAFRWSIGFRFVLVFAAAYAASLIWRSRRRALAAVLIVLAAVEIMPAPRYQTLAGRNQARQVSAVRNQLFAQFDKLTKHGERILVLPASNDFSVNAMAPFAGVKTYNVGVDKSYAGSKAKWPPAVKAAADGIGNSVGQGDRVAAVLRHDADAVVISYVDLYKAGLGWPAPEQNPQFVKQQADTLSADPRFVAARGTLMTVLRRRRR